MRLIGDHDLDRRRLQLEQKGRVSAEPVEAGLPDPSRFRVTLDEGKDLDLRGYLRDIEVALIEAALDRRQGCVTRAENMLRLRRTTLIEKMKKFCVRRELAAEE